MGARQCAPDAAAPDYWDANSLRVEALPVSPPGRPCMPRVTSSSRIPGTARSTFRTRPTGAAARPFFAELGWMNERQRGDAAARVPRRRARGRRGGRARSRRGRCASSGTSPTTNDQAAQERARRPPRTASRSGAGCARSSCATAAAAGRLHARSPSTDGADAVEIDQLYVTPDGARHAGIGGAARRGGAGRRRARRRRGWSPTTTASRARSTSGSASRPSGCQHAFVAPALALSILTSRALRNRTGAVGGRAEATRRSVPRAAADPRTRDARDHRASSAVALAASSRSRSSPTSTTRARAGSPTSPSSSPRTSRSPGTPA